MSPCHQRPSLAIHFTWKPDKDGVRVLFPAIEDKLAPFEARPRGSKLFVMGIIDTSIALRKGRRLPKARS